MSKMNEEIRERWTAALRSGKYSQGTSKLLDRGRFCCLGVLCDLYAEDHPEAGWESDRRSEGFMSFFCDGDDFEDNTTYLPAQVMSWAGLEERNPRLYGGECLANLNDGGTPFRVIAKLIEEQL